MTHAVLRHRRGGAALLVAGLVCAMASAFLWHYGPPAHADATLSSFGFQSGARGWRLYMQDPANGDQEGEVPEASVYLNNGPVGYALSSVVWPGPLASNAGSLILVLRPDAPSQVTALNNPLRAEARTGQSPPTKTNNSAPGVSMVSTAKDDLVEATAKVDNSSGGGTFGASQTHATSALTGGVGKSSSDSLVQDINLAAGVVKIDSVSSVATATTDGVKSSGEAHTVVNGMTIGGQPAYLDETGLHIGSQGQPANAVANQIAQQALGKSGTTITMSQPSKETKDAATTATAGSLVVSWDTGSGQVFTVTLGGAMAGVTAAPGTDVSLVEVAVPGVDSGSGSLPSTDTGSASVPVDASTGASSGSSTPASIGSTGTRATTATGSPPLKLAGHSALIGTGSVVLALFAAGLMGFGMRRLSDGILAEPVAAICPLAEDD